MNTNSEYSRIPHNHNAYFLVGRPELLWAIALERAAKNGFDNSCQVHMDNGEWIHIEITRNSDVEFVNHDCWKSWDKSQKNSSDTMRAVLWVVGNLLRTYGMQFPVHRVGGQLEL
jgi:hypothetical protein